MRFSVLVLLSAVGMAMAAPAAEPAPEDLESRQSGLGCVYGNNQCPAKCRAVYGRACTLSYCNAYSSQVPYGSCICRC